MEADFEGYATKANLKCSDGRTITPQAFQHMDQKQVPLVWQHGHNDPGNVLGYATLEHRDDGVWARGFFNTTPNGQNAKALVEHGDIKAMSIYANQLVEKSKQVLHGVIREVSLVLAGANPGALIENVRVAHSSDDIETLDDEAIITSGSELEHGVKTYVTEASSSRVTKVDGEVVSSSSSTNVSTETVPDGQNGGLAYSDAEGEDLEHGKTVKDVYDSLTSEQQEVVTYMIGQALEATKTASHSDGDDDTTSTTDEGDLKHTEGTAEMTRNVFEQDAIGGNAEQTTTTLSHEDVKGIVANAVKVGSLKEAVEQYAVQHGITNIDLLFPDAKSITSSPDFNARRTEWVAQVLNTTRHTPFSRVKTIVADLTQDEARAKGYIKGTLKKEEWFGLSRRTTTPTTVYKKQQLDRDDIVDITDFDVVAWLKAEMRIMLEEEIARAILVGDGRDVANGDKIKDPVGASDGVGIRSIVNDHELFVTTLNVNLDDASSSYEEVIDVVMDGMEFYKGTGTPDAYMTIGTLNKFLKAKDTTGRRLYKDKTEVAAALGVRNVVNVDIMNDDTSIVAVIVNLADYNIGADRGGEVSMFDDFDIDYNRQKYLIETRLSGALVKIKSALVVKKTAAANVLATPTKPTFVQSTGVVTIPTVTGVTYKNSATSATLTAGAQTALAPGASLGVIAVPNAGYYFSSNAADEFTFTRPA
jgi:HK97 family phage prohead protease